MLESTQSYRNLYKPKQHFSHYHQFSSIPNIYDHNDLGSTYYNSMKDTLQRQNTLNEQNSQELLSSLTGLERISNSKQKRIQSSRTRNKINSRSINFTNLCLVCGDQSSGIHYGVRTCEGCKGFFRRATLHETPEPCNHTNDCAITILNRNYCQYCRLKKCFDVGMNRDASRLGRPPKRSHSDKKTSDIQEEIPLKKSSNSIFPKCLFEHRRKIFITKIHDEILRKITSMLIHQEKLLTHIEIQELNQLEEIIVHTHLLFTTLTYEKIQKKIKENLPIATDSINNYQINSEPVLAWVNWQSKLPYKNILKIFRSYQFFQDISPNDQMCLLQYGIFESILVNWFSLFDIKRKLMLNSDLSAYIDRNLIKTKDMLGIFMLEIFDLGIKANYLRWTDSNIALFNAILMMNPERPNLCDKEKIREIEAKLMQVFHRHLRRYHPDDSNLFLDILQLIPLIQEINHIYLAAIQYIKQHQYHIFNTLPDIQQQIHKDLMC